MTRVNGDPIARAPGTPRHSRARGEGKGGGRIDFGRWRGEGRACSMCTPSGVGPGDKKALAEAGMVVGKVNSSLQAHFEKVGETMAKEWSQKAGSRGAAVLSSYK